MNIRSGGKDFNLDESVGGTAYSDGYVIGVVGGADGMEDQDREFCACKGSFRLLPAGIGMLRKRVSTVYELNKYVNTGKV